MPHPQFAERNDALFKASIRGDLEQVKRLAAQGANVRAKGARGTSSVLFAAGNGHWNVVRWLVTHGADPNSTDLDGFSLAYEAAAHGKMRLLKFLRHRGMDCRVDAVQEISLLSAAVREDQLPMILWLLRRDWELRKAECLNGVATKTARKFIENGVPFFETGKNRNRVVHKAARKGNLALVRCSGSTARIFGNPTPTGGARHR